MWSHQHVLASMVCSVVFPAPGDICRTCSPSNSVLELSSRRKCLCLVPNVCVKVFCEPLPWLPGDRGGISHPKTTVTSEIVIIQNPSIFDSRPTTFFSHRDSAAELSWTSGYIKIICHLLSTHPPWCERADQRQPRRPVSGREEASSPGRKKLV